MKISYNGFEVTEPTEVCGEIAICQCSKGNNSKECNSDLWFLRSAHRLILLNICVKFHENISNGFLVIGQTRFCDRQTTDVTGKNNM